MFELEIVVSSDVFGQPSGEAGARLWLRELGLARARAIAEWTAERARALCPVDTGHLRSTIQVVEDPGGGGWLVVAAAEYAAAVEFGYMTSTGRVVAPNPFLRRALADARGHFGLE